MNELAYLNALPAAVLAVDHSLKVTFINQAAEMLLKTSAQQVLGRPLNDIAGFEEALCDLCERVFSDSEAVTLFEYALKLPMDHRSVTLHVTPVVVELRARKIFVPEVLITIEKDRGLDQLTGSALKQEVTRVTGIMAAMLAHEVKNPLSGIRGAAQLLKDEVSPEHQPLTDLICMETDRIRDLLDQVEIFAAGAPEGKQQVNIHEVLQYVIGVAQTGFARHVKFKEIYDPSLPLVASHRDMLVQLFLNLIKNSAEALAGKPDATITLTTGYRSGYRVRIGASEEKVALPVAVTIEDNGPGIPEAVRPHLFEPFVSSKEEGRGLGLAIVAKIASDIGAAVDLDKDFEGGTRFNVWMACGK